MVRPGQCIHFTLFSFPSKDFLFSYKTAEGCHSERYIVQKCKLNSEEKKKYNFHETTNTNKLNTFNKDGKYFNARMREKPVLVYFPKISSEILASCSHLRPCHQLAL